jgi:hypothetical protein
LGIEVTKINDGILLSENKYAMNLLKRAGMSTCKPVNTPLSTLEKLSAHDGEILGLEDATSYHSIVGGLQYLTFTYLDLAFFVNKVCQYLHYLTSVHLTSVKPILRYVRGTTNMGLHIMKSLSMLVSGFSDMEWARCLDDRWLTEGICYIYGFEPSVMECHEVVDCI